jgi:hypothetical protein
MVEISFYGIGVSSGFFLSTPWILELPVLALIGYCDRNF